MKKCHQYYALAVSIYPNLLTLADKIENANFESIAKILSTPRDFTVVHRNKNVIVRTRSLHIENGFLYGGRIAILKHERISTDNGTELQDEIIDNNPNAIFALTRNGQRIFIEKQIESKFGHKIEVIASFLQTIFQRELGNRGKVFVKLIPKRHAFWDTIKTIKKLKEVTFEFVAPNIEGATEQEIRNFLCGIQKNFNTTEYVETFRNDDGMLQVPQNSFFTSRSKTIEQAGGKWGVKGDGKHIKSDNKNALFDPKDITELDGISILDRILRGNNER